MTSFVPTYPWIVTLVCLLMGCAPRETAPPPAPVEPAAAREAHAEPELEEVADEAPRPSVRTATADLDDTDRIAARHILVSHAGAAQRPMSVSRDADAARAKAQQLLDRIRRGEDFAALAQAESDCKSRSKGGFLGAFGHGAMAPPFEEAAYALEVGEVSGLVESQFGFHIIRREELVEVHVAQILLHVSPGTPDPEGTLRAAAGERALQARVRLDAGEPFEQVAKELSTGPSAPWGGDLGWLIRGDSLPEWEQHAFALEPGEIVGPFETEVGYHIIKRLQ
jgi:parvulin-like peptidyl-prolyl isomerase